MFFQNEGEQCAEIARQLDAKHGKWLQGWLGNARAQGTVRVRSERGGSSSGYGIRGLQLSRVEKSPGSAGEQQLSRSAAWKLKPERSCRSSVRDGFFQQLISHESV